MAWIESHQSLAHHPKLNRLLRLLRIPRAAAIGHLHLLWWWALDHADDGDLRAFSDEDLADATWWDGDAGELVTALTQAGFLDPDRTLHDWRDYAGRLLDQREAAAERMRRVRERARNTPERSPNVRARSPLTGTGTGTLTGTRTGTGEEDAPPAPRSLHAVPKPRRAREVAEKIRAAGADVVITPRDTEALQACDAEPELIAEAYVAAWRGKWGDDFDREHLSIHRVVENLAGYRASKRKAGRARDPKDYISGPYGHLIHH